MLKLIGAIAFCLIVIVIGNYVIVAQTSLSGEWTIDKKGTDNGSVHLNFRQKVRGGNFENGREVDFNQLRGLTREQLDGDGPVRFSLVREAGTIECEGKVENGRGRGSFSFTPNDSYVQAMKSRGFDFEKSSKNDRSTTVERLFQAASINVTVAHADDLLSADFLKLEVDDLFAAVIFKINSEFLREMKASGFQNLRFDDLVQARVFKIDGEYLRELASQGFDKEPFENVVKMRIFNITPEFVTGVRAEGFEKLDIEGLVQFKIFNINAKFIREARADGVPMEVEKLVERRIGVRTR